MVVWISLDTDRKKLDDFIAKNQLPGPHIFDGKGWEMELAKKFNINGIPMNYVLDHDGKIVSKGHTQKEMQAAIVAAIKGEKIPGTQGAGTH